MELKIDRATPADKDELLALYLSVYGEDYPLSIGTNSSVMKRALSLPEEYIWFIVRDEERKVIIGSTIVELDLSYKIGKVIGVTVAKAYQGNGISHRLIEHATEFVFGKNLVNSLYATCRTLSISSQAMLLSNGFHPLGIFPNARKIKVYETLGLMGKFQKGVLEKRAELAVIPSILSPICELIGETTKNLLRPHAKACPPLPKAIASGDDNQTEFEFISAPNFVQKRYKELFENEKEATFYPFHSPNLIISEHNLQLEIFASFSKKDHYCVIICSNKNLRELKHQMRNLIYAMKEIGVYYVELLVRMDNFESICFLTENRFIPSAVYPAMHEVDGRMYDYVLLTRTMVPLDFIDLEIHPKLVPFFKLYTEQWSKMNLKTFGGETWKKD